LYLRDAGEWAPEPAMAKDFLSSTAAIEFCLQHKLVGVQIVLKFADQKHDIVFPLRGHGYHKAHGPRDVR